VNAGCDSMNRPKIMIHIDQGGNRNKTKYFFDKLLSYGIDLILSGNRIILVAWQFIDLRSNMIFMAETYKKPIILVEVAYCSSPTEYKGKTGSV